MPVLPVVALRLRHRGPDWAGIHTFKNNFLAHERLAIVDPASGDQPLFNETKDIVLAVSHLRLYGRFWVAFSTVCCAVG